MRLPHWGWIAGFVVIALGLSASGVEAAFHFNGWPMDGPFQLFDALRRISAGQRIGDTFQFFHGPAIPYLFFPAFAAGGSTFFAAELSRQVVSVVLFLASALIVFRGMAGSWKAGIPLAVVAALVMIEFRLTAVVLPINSILGVRSTMPLLIAAHLVLRAPGRRADFERGALLGLAVLLGTEQGIAALAALTLTLAAVSLRRGGWRMHLREWAVTTATAIPVYLAIVLLLAGPAHVGSVLRFNFVEVQQDQLWYFGAPPNPFLSRWSQIPALLDPYRWWVAIGLAVAIAVRGFASPEAAPEDRRPMAEVFLVLYGLISLASLLGMILITYVEPAARVSIIVIIGWIYRRWPTWRDRLPANASRLRRRLPLIATMAIVAISVVRERPAMESLVRVPLHVVGAHLVNREPPTMSPWWMQTEAIGLLAVDDLRRATGRTPVIWSTYAALLEWRTGVFHPGTDYIIHTLGPRRRAAYAAQFVATRPDLVQTIRPSFTYYEEWLEAAHWDFYRPLLADYDISAAGPWSFFWTRRAGPPPPRGNVIVTMSVPAGMSTISVDPALAVDSLGVFDVHVHYRVDNGLAKIPVLGGLPRYLIDAEGSANLFSISLAPYAHERSFPVVLRGGSPIRLRAHVESLLGAATLTVDSIRIERVHVSPANAAWVRDFVTRSRNFGQ